MSRATLNEFMRFCVVGGIAFLVDAAMLEAFVYGGVSPRVARIISIAIALHVSYVLHGLFTYRNHHGFSQRAWKKFMASNLIGAAINYTIFLLVLSAQLGNCPQNSRLIALVAGTTIALAFNYWANRRYVFLRKGS